MSETLTKAGIIEAIQKENGYSLKKPADIIETLLEIIKRTLESSEDVMIFGFGKFQVIKVIKGQPLKYKFFRWVPLYFSTRPLHRRTNNAKSRSKLPQNI